MDINIRKGNINDLDALSLIEAECFPPEEAAGKKALEGRLRAYAGCFLVMEHEGRAIGFINGMVSQSPVLEDEMYENPSLHDPDGPWQMVFGLDIMPAYRKMGLGGQLLSEFCRMAKGEGRRGVVLTCKKELLGFYGSLGFENMGVSPSVHGGAVWYEMRLEF